MRSVKVYGLVLIVSLLIVACSKQDDSAKQATESTTASAESADSQVAIAKTASKPKGGLAFDTGISNRTNPRSDWALINGKIYTVNPKQPWATAIVVEDNKITYVGDAQG
ncbi:hypothetical protein, partial [Kaarinaea lacus]